MLIDTFIINLEKDKDRMKDIDKNFTKYGLKYKRVDAVYGKNLTPEEIKENTTLLCRTLTCNKSIIGSGMSHLKIWKHISSQPIGFYMICEDDINFNDSSVPNINKILDLMKGREGDPILISLNSCESYNYHLSNSLVVKGTFICGISCYIITPETAKALVDFLQKNKLNQYVDLQITFCKCGIQYYITTVPVVNDSTFGGYKTSNNMGSLYSLPFLQFIIDLCLPTNWSSVLNFRLNLIVICLFMTYCFSIGSLLLLILFLANIFFWKIEMITNYILLECILIVWFKIFN